MDTPVATSLSQLFTGSRGVVAAIQGGREMTGRLAAMGLTPGAEIQVLQNLGRGPVLAKIRDTRIALGRRQASLVFVHECRSQELPAPGRPFPGR
ncbi:MAG: FeoA family protein [Gammaproteobacteria bacterium]